MRTSGGDRVRLGNHVIQKLRSCAERLGLPADEELSRVIDLVTDDYLRQHPAIEPSVKRGRGSTTAASRDIVSEVALSSFGWNLTELKRREVVYGDPDLTFAALRTLPVPLRQLVLLVAETPRSPDDLPRDTLVALLLEGLSAHDASNSAALKEELALVDFMAARYFKVIAEHTSLAALSAEFGDACPRLRGLFVELAIGSHVGDNSIRTEEVKMEWMLVLASAIGKVRNVRRCGFAEVLYALWKSIGVPVEAINILSNLGLSLSASDGASKMKATVNAERKKLAYELYLPGAALISCVVFDNIDVSLGTRSFVKSEVALRHRQIHVTAASVMFMRNPRPALAAAHGRSVVLPLSCLFADASCQVRLTGAIALSLHRTLHPYGFELLACIAERPIALVDFGGTLRSRRQALPVYWLEEGKIQDMYEFVKDIMCKYRDRSRVHFVGDCFSLQKLLAVRELLSAENLKTRHDPELHGMVLVPGFFHLYWNLFLGSLLQSDRDLLMQMVEISGLSNLRLHKDISTCFNDIDHLVTILYPVVAVRVYRFFRDVKAPGMGLVLEEMGEKEVMTRFALFVAFTVQRLDRSSGVVESERLCRVLLLLSVYRSLRVAIAAEDHAQMVDVLYFSVTLVCQGSFKQYRKIIIEAVAHFARSTAEERELYKQCFTGSYSGGYMGGRSLDEIREFDNKATKESLRKSHRSEGDLAPELELTEQQREVRRVFSSAFACLETGSGGAIPELPTCKVVLELADRKQWAELDRVLTPEEAKNQVAFFDFSSHTQVVKDTLYSLHRGWQFSE